MKTNDSDLERKTDYPDLERSPDVNKLKHFVYVLLNKPRWFIENLYEKYLLKYIF